MRGEVRGYVRGSVRTDDWRADIDHNCGYFRIRSGMYSCSSGGRFLIPRRAAFDTAYSSDRFTRLRTFSVTSSPFSSIARSENIQA